MRLLAALLAALATLAGLPAAAEPVEIRATPVPLDTDQPERDRVGRLLFVAGYEIRAAHAGWGGFSDLDLAPDGATLQAVSDYGFFLTLPVVHDKDGRLLPPTRGDLARLIDLDGRPMNGKRGADAEAMARLEDGALIVAFERRHRLLRYPPGRSPTTTQPELLPPPEGLGGLPANAGIEALVALPQGGIVAFAEDPLDGDSFGIAWLRDHGGWHRLKVTRSLLFRPTAAALLPGGDVLLLERRFTLIGGVAARLSRVSAGAFRPDAVMAPVPLAELASPLSVDNFEGMAVGRGPAGETFVYLISDDNLSPLQRTLLMQFRLDVNEAGP